MENKELEEMFIENTKNIDARARLIIQIQIQNLKDNVEFYKGSTKAYIQGYKDSLQLIIELLSKSASESLKEEYKE